VTEATGCGPCGKAQPCGRWVPRLQSPISLAVARGTPRWLTRGGLRVRSRWTGLSALRLEARRRPPSMAIANTPKGRERWYVQVYRLEMTTFSASSTQRGHNGTAYRPVDDARLSEAGLDKCRLVP
jgi:hypothetical protein